MREFDLTMLVKVIGAVIICLPVSIIGIVIGYMGDVSPDYEWPFTRFLLMSVVYSIGGLYIGYFLPRVWYWSLAVAWGPIVFGMLDIGMIIGQTSSGARWILLNATFLSTAVALLSGYAGYLLKRRISHTPPQDSKLSGRFAFGTLTTLLILYVAYMVAGYFFAEKSIVVRPCPTLNVISSPTAFHNAAENGDLEEIIRQIELGENVDVRDMSGRTPLHYAVCSQQVPAVELLLSLKASPDIQDKENGATPLHWAVGSGNLDIVNLLAPRMKNINAQNNEGETPLLIAFIDSKYEILEVLVAHGADWGTKDVE